MADRPPRAPRNLQEWTEDLDPTARSAAAAFLLFVTLGEGDDVKKPPSARFWTEAAKKLREFAQSCAKDLRGAARPRETMSYSSVPDLVPLFREIDARRAAKVWTQEFTKTGAVLCWRVGITSGEMSSITALAQWVANREIGVCSLTWVRSHLPGRSRWRWPLRIGYFRRDADIADAIAKATKGVHGGLSVPVLLGGGAESCDLLLISGPFSESLSSRLRITASAVVRIDKQLASSFNLCAMADSAVSRFKASAAAIVQSAAETYVRALLDAISHDYPLDVAIHDAARFLKLAQPPLVMGEDDFLDRTTVQAASMTFAAQAVVQIASAGASADLMRALPAQTFDFELTGATFAANRVRSLEKEVLSPNAPSRSLLATSLGFPGSLEEQLAVGTVPVKALVRGGVNFFDIWIGAGSPGVTGLRLDESEIDWRGGDHVELQVTLMAATGHVIDYPWLSESRVSRAGISIMAAPGYLERMIDRSFDRRWQQSRFSVGADRSGLSLLHMFQSSEHRGRARTHRLHSILLRRGGESTHAIVPMIIPSDLKEFSARVILAQSNRVLMTARLTGSAVDYATAVQEAEKSGSRSHVNLAMEGIVRDDIDDIDDTREFDAAFVANHTSAGEERVSALADGLACEIDFKGLEAAPGVIADHLLMLTKKPQEFDGPDSKRYAAFLFALAHHGIALRDRLVGDTQLDGMIERGVIVDRVQVISAVPEALLPLEFIYEGDGPIIDASICPNASAAMNTQIAAWRPGSGDVDEAMGCPSTCVHRRGSQHVCPLRFWGVTKTIERHMFDKDKAVPAKDFRVSRSQPLAERNKFPRPRHGILASSAAAWSVAPAAEQDVTLRLKNAAGNTTQVASWPDWSGAVKSNQPTLLVAVPHQDVESDNTYLEIGDGSNAVLHRLFYGNLTSDMVKASKELPVLVILMGCETAQPKATYASFPARFRKHDANIVLATISPILGRFGGPFAGEILRQLEECWNSQGEGFTLGEIIRRARLRYAALGNPIGFTLVAYGDADWTFGG